MTIFQFHSNLLSSLLARFVYFFVAPASPRPFACLRIGMASFLLVKAWVEFNHLLDLYGNRGLFPWIIGEILIPDDWSPRMSWYSDALNLSDAGRDILVYVVFSLYVLSLIGLLIGFHSRLMAIFAWLTHLTLLNNSGMSAYGVDAFSNIALFYCVIMPVGASASLDHRFDRTSEQPTSSARLFLRLLQIHLCLVYLTSGLAKAKGIQWWNGEAIWRAIMQPQFKVFDLSWLAWVPWLAMLICWGTLLLELGYCVFIWLPQTRALWLLSIIGLHFCIGLIMGLWLFAAVMIILNLSAFGSALPIGWISNSQKFDLPLLD
jgi:hypothetical protein